MLATPHKFLDDAYLRKHPKIALNGLSQSPLAVFEIANATTSLFIATYPDAVVEILLDPRFVKGPAIQNCRYLLGDGTATSDLPPDGAEFYGDFGSLDAFRRHKRRILGKAFGRSTQERQLRELANNLDTGLYIWEDGLVDVADRLTEIMLSSSLPALFNRRLNRSVLEMARVCRESLPAIDKIIRIENDIPDEVFDRGGRAGNEEWRWDSSGSHRRLTERRQAIHRAIDQLVADGPIDPDRTDDVISAILNSDPKFNRHQLTTSIVGLLFASYENSVTAAVWTLGALAADQGLLDQVRNDIRVSEFRSPLLSACIRESLRLFPPVWATGREATVDAEIRGTKVPSGGVVVVSPWIQHRHVDLWSDPCDFRPDRYSNHSPVKGSYLPFGLGPRTCIGMNFAVSQLEFILAEVLRHYTVHPGPNESNPSFFATLQPNPGLVLRVERRSL